MRSNPELAQLAAQINQGTGVPLNREQRRAARHKKPKGLRGLVNVPAFLDVMQRCRGYSDEPLPGSWLPGTQDTADQAIKMVTDAFESMRAGLTPTDTEEHFDLIAHALGVACIRAGQIAGTEPTDNIMLPPLIAANAAMRQVLARRRKWGKWEMLPAEIDAADYALDIYETIVRASSPAQMSDAVDLRMVALKGQFLETLESK